MTKKKIPAGEALVKLIGGAKNIYDNVEHLLRWTDPCGVEALLDGVWYPAIPVEKIEYYEHTEPETRLMTKDECRAWACSADALGWMVKLSEDSGWAYPTCHNYIYAIGKYQRQRIGKDGKMIGEPEGFTVPAEDEE
jgi:hypothetical protein